MFNQIVTAGLIGRVNPGSMRKEPMHAIECEGLECRRENWNGRGLGEIHDFSLRIAPGEFVGFCGPDGCGKGLLLNLIGLLERPDAGVLRLAGEFTETLAGDERADLRNETFGFLFGHPYLLPAFTIAENVAMPLFRIRGGDAREARDKTLAALEFVGIPGFESPPAGRVPQDIRWRAAFARALIHSPRILIAISPPCQPDLPALARRAADHFGLTVLWAGDPATLTPVADRILTLREGHLLNEVA